MKLCIAEKPSVAKDIAQVIGAKTKMNGYYEGNGYWVSWTFGHLCTLKEPNDYTEKWKYWNLETLPMIPAKFGIKLINDGGVKKQFQVLERLIGDCDEVINCGDAGQEGELIQRWVLAKAKNEKPLKRLWISSLTEEAIKEGFDKLQDGKKYDQLYAAGASRAIGDWVLGMNATRLFTLKFGQKGQVLSIGRVQTPTLAMIVERQLEIDNFKSEKYWEIRTFYRETEFSCSLGKIETKEKGEELLQKITGQNFEVVSFEQKEGTEKHPMLFDLTALQVECNKRFAFSAEDTLNMVQKLYEQKLVTYPRVDTTYLSEDIYPKVEGTLRNLKHYTRFTEPLLGQKIRKSKRVFDDKKVTDHHAIIPTGIVPSGITPNEQKVYDAITRRFICVFYPDCKVSNTVVEGESVEVPFRASGRQVLEPGWRTVYEDYVSGGSKKDDEEQMPLFEQGESGEHTPELQEKKTKPPRYFTEASLLRAMETAGKQVDDDDLRDIMKENGIGRPSTRANIIETLFKRNYIAKEKKRIVATATGVHLISLINNDLLKSAELTGQWEKKLRDIEKGNFEVEEFKKELTEMVVHLCHEVKHQVVEPPPVLCPKCGKGEMIRGKKAWGCSRFNSGCKYTIPFKFKDVFLSDADMKELVINQKSRYRLPFKSKSGEVKKHYVGLNDKLKPIILNDEEN
ncbi:DNA topoisomerase 3 [Parvicella tangerina]|uniref:DNA topoisomerase n=1 Tax=Parvicella tangerina TaxID=2829795 RepID=A0A916NB35_9FLAO|nr:DNA topoisomerase 3 [Parvicella tangerina]CAG5080288.1 DNA topoisomerase 3 [Parvicella tangerina]